MKTQWIVRWGESYWIALPTWSEAAEYARGLMLSGWPGSVIRIEPRS
jgi:hypothetical protein